MRKFVICASLLLAVWISLTSVTYARYYQSIRVQGRLTLAIPDPTPTPEPSPEPDPAPAEGDFPALVEAAYARLMQAASTREAAIALMHASYDASSGRSTQAAGIAAGRLAAQSEYGSALYVSASQLASDVWSVYHAIAGTANSALWQTASIHTQNAEQDYTNALKFYAQSVQTQKGNQAETYFSNAMEKYLRLLAQADAAETSATNALAQANIARAQADAAWERLDALRAESAPQNPDGRTPIVTPSEG